VAAEPPGGGVTAGLTGGSRGADFVGVTAGLSGEAVEDYGGPTVSTGANLGPADEDYGGPTLPGGSGDVRAAAAATTDPDAPGTPCPSCGNPVGGDDRFCERCGSALHVGGGPAGRGVVWQSTTAGVTRCPGCGETAVTADGQCEGCRRARTTGSDRTVLDLPGIAGVSDRGTLRGRNEDALAIGRFDGDGSGVTVAIVCDGVSTSPRGDTAARAAADAAIVVLLDMLARGHDARRATEAGTAAAAAAVADLPGARSLAVPPSCTYVSAVVAAGEVTVGWVGDSRAYWLGADEVRALTVDDSPAAQLLATGVPVPGVDPFSVALLRWLGADTPDPRPHIATLSPAGPGRVLICSDGLSRYAKNQADLARVAASSSPAAAARELTEFAIDAGGRDNITVALLPYPPGGSR
jgi:serine/threonine protein phosphatase PrpC